MAKNETLWKNVIYNVIKLNGNTHAFLFLKKYT